jgi:putative redox protein
MTIKTIYTGDLHTTCEHIQSGTIIHTDAPTDNHGLGQSFSPTDLLATAAGTCAITFLAVQTIDTDIDFKGSEIEITKIMSKLPPRKIEKLEMILRMKTSRLVSDEEKNKYEEITKNCPVMLSLHPDLVKKMSFDWG